MSSNIITDIINLWSDSNPVAGYTSGHLKELTTLFVPSAENIEQIRKRNTALQNRLNEIGDKNQKNHSSSRVIVFRNTIKHAEAKWCWSIRNGDGWSICSSRWYFLHCIEKRFPC